MYKNMTTGNPAKLILFFALPLFIGNMFQQFYSLADTLIVGRFLGVQSLAAVGCTGSIIFLIIGLVQGLTAGLAMITAQRFGAGDDQGVKNSIITSAFICFIATIVLTSLSIFFLKPLLVFMQTPPEIIAAAYTYIFIICCGLGATFLFNLLANLILALGDSKTPLFFLAFASILNILLDLLFIRVFSFGVAGAAWATVIAQLVNGLLCLNHLRKRMASFNLSWTDWKFELALVRRHLQIGLPMGFQAAIIAIGAIALQIALNGLGSIAVAAYTAASKIEMLAILPMMSFGISMGIFTAQNYGAGNIKRIRLAVRECVIMSVGFSILAAIVNIFFGQHFVELFVGLGNQQLVVLAQKYFLVSSLNYPVVAFLFVFRYTLQGIGKTLVPTFAGVMEMAMRTIAALVLVGNLGFVGASLANPLAWWGSCIPLGIAYFMTMKDLDQNKQYC
ncbi:MAG: MATE family efflux transporter [Clostridia bacterium]